MRQWRSIYPTEFSISKKNIASKQHRKGHGGPEIFKTKNHPWPSMASPALPFFGMCTCVGPIWAPAKIYVKKHLKATSIYGISTVFQEEMRRYRAMILNHESRIPINQPGFNGKEGRVSWPWRKDGSLGATLFSQAVGEAFNLSDWWLNHPSEKVKMRIFPKRDENTKYLKQPPSCVCFISIIHFCSQEKPHGFKPRWSKWPGSLQKGQASSSPGSRLSFAKGLAIDTLPETNSSPLNIDPWKRTFLLETHHFLKRTVSFREGALFWLCGGNWKHFWMSKFPMDFFLMSPFSVVILIFLQWAGCFLVSVLRQGRHGNPSIPGKTLVKFKLQIFLVCFMFLLNPTRDETKEIKI